MGRPQLALGTAGRVRVYPLAGDGFRARALYRDYDGQVRPVERKGHTRGAAERALAVALRDRARFDADSAITPDSKFSVVAEHWYAELASEGKSPSTVQAYRDRLDRQLLPALGAVRVRELTVGLVDRHLAAVKAKHGSPVAKLTKSVLSGVCRFACRHDSLKHNPCRDVAKISTKPKRPPRSLSVAEIRQLRAFLTYDDVALAKDLPDLIGFMLATGMRIGEAAALQWDAVDLNAGTVDVRGTVLRIRGQGLVIKPNPTGRSGERVLKLPSWATTMLKLRYDARHAPRSRPHLPVVFATELGNLRDPSNTRRDMQKAFERAGRPELTPNVFRKSVASLMSDSGLPARAAADQLGHSQVTTTLNRYKGRMVRATGAAEVLEVLGES